MAKTHAKRPAAKRSTPKRARRSKLATVHGPSKISETPGWISLFGQTSGAGVEVDEGAALSLSAVFAGVNLYANILASLPLFVYRRANGRKEVADDLSVQTLLHTQPNPEMSAFTWRRLTEWFRLLWGHAESEIVWGDDGEAKELWPIEPWRIYPDRDDNGDLIYVVDSSRKIAAKDIVSVTLVSQDGVSGRSFISYAIDSLGLGIAEQAFAGSFFANGTRPGGILKHASTPTEEARNKFRKAWNERHGAPGKAYSTAVLWGGWEYEDAGGAGKPIESQLLESRKFFTEEVARWLNIPPILLHDLTRSTWNNLEQMNLFMLQYSLGPVLIQYEQEWGRKLLAPPVTFCKHKIEGFLRADSAARAAFLKEMFMIGGKTINDILDLEDENGIGSDGDVRFVPANMTPLERAIKGPAVDPKQAPPPGAPQNNQQPEQTPAADDAPTPASSDGSTPASKGSKVAAQQGDVQATALNGAQIASLVQVVIAVTEDTMPSDTAKAALKGSFPLMGEALISEIIDPLDVFKAKRKKEKPTAPPPSEQKPAPDLKPALRGVLAEALGRMVRKEINAARRAVKDPAKMAGWIDAFYPEHQALVADAIRPAIAACLVAAGDPRDAAAFAAEIAARDADTSRRQLAASHSSIDQWENRAEQTAQALIEVIYAGH